MTIFWICDCDHRSDLVCTPLAGALTGRGQVQVYQAASQLSSSSCVCHIQNLYTQFTFIPSLLLCGSSLRLQFDGTPLILAQPPFA